MTKRKKQYINRELSWLSFNERVLQEAADPTVPLLMRLRFLGIFSNNRDEFYRVRVATLNRAVEVNKKAKVTLGFSPKKILKQIHQQIVRQEQRFEEIYEDLLDELRKQEIYVLNELELTRKQGQYIKKYFLQEVRPELVPLMVDSIKDFPNLKDGSVYLAVQMLSRMTSLPPRCALIEIPCPPLSRFLVLRKQKGKHFVILLDDVIRYCLDEIFAIFNYDIYEAYTIKITKDSELDLDSDISKSFLELLKEGLKKRKVARATRFIFDQNMPDSLLSFLIKRLNLSSEDSIIPAGRYHNFKDFMNFPKLGSAPELNTIPTPPLEHPHINSKESFFELLKKRDIMLHYPYHSFNPFIDFLREAAIDPRVEYIKITLYRVGKISQVVNALINAHLNGKEVTVVMELQARFDEEANIKWTKVLLESGVKVLHGPSDIKIHSKICLIGRREKQELARYVNFSTGNYNEDTAKVYCDDSLFTAHQGIALEAEQIFNMITNGSKKNKKFKHLLVSPQHMKQQLLDLIDQEIKNVEKKLPAYIIIKLNNLNEEEVIDKLYDASNAGVTIKLIIRGICSLVSGVEEISENIEAISLVDKYLEHSRIIIFANGGDELFYLSSADWMDRNLNRRIEVACPIYDKEIRADLRSMISYQLVDNTKARWLDHIQSNTYKKSMDDVPIRSQNIIYDYFKEKIEDTYEIRSD